MRSNKELIRMAGNLAENGLEMSEIQHKDTKRFVRALTDRPLFSIAAAWSIIWAQYALPGRDNDLVFIEPASQFIISGNKRLFKEACVYEGRYGEKLEEVLNAWYKMYHKIVASFENNKTILDVKKISMENLIEMQHRSIAIAKDLKGTLDDEDDELSGFRSWLLIAPYKIILAYRKDLWSHPRVNELFMPLGLEVNRGIRKLFKEDYKYTDLQVNEFRDDEPRFNDTGLGTLFLAHKFSEEIANMSKSLVIHINLGLWLFGAGEI